VNPGGQGPPVTEEAVRKGTCVDLGALQWETVKADKGLSLWGSCVSALNSSLGVAVGSLEGPFGWLQLVSTLAVVSSFSLVMGGLSWKMLSVCLDPREVPAVPGKPVRLVIQIGSG